MLNKLATCTAAVPRSFGSWLIVFLAPALVLALVPALLWPGAALAQDGPIANVDDAHRAVVHIVSYGSFRPVGETEDQLLGGEGSGFIVDPEGIVVTNAHVVNGGNLFQVYLDGEDEPRNAALLGVSECSDLAVLDIRGSGFPYLAWDDSLLLRGTDVWALGYPGGNYRATQGEVTKAGVQVDSPWASIERVVVHNARLRPGNSGGPLLNRNGGVIAVNYGGVTNRPIYEGIAADVAAPIVDVLRLGQDVDSLGINGEAFVDSADEYGIWVVAVESGSPADRAGLKPGDVLTALEGLPVGYDASMRTYCDILRSHPPAAAIAFTVRRGDETLAGQVNGVALAAANSGAAAASAPQATQRLAPAPEPDRMAEAVPSAPDGFRVVSGDSGVVQVIVPAGWTEVSEGPIGFGSVNLGPLLAAEGQDQDQEHSLWMSVGVTLKGDRSLEEMLYNRPYVEHCRLYQRQNVFTVDFTGLAEVWTNCEGADGHSALVAALQPSWDDEVIVAVTVFGLEELESLEASIQPLGAALRSHPVFYDVPTGTVKADILNLRAGPGIDQDKLGELALDDVVFVYGKDGDACDWLFVNNGERAGWIAGNADYVALDRACSALQIITPSMIEEWRAAAPDGS